MPRAMIPRFCSGTVDIAGAGIARQGGGRPVPGASRRGMTDFSERRQPDEDRVAPKPET